VYYILPAFIFRVKKIPFMSSLILGFTPCNIVFLLDGDTPDILVHELVHVRQFYRYLIFYWIGYAIPYFRLKIEVAAYVTQANWLMANTKNPNISNILTSFAHDLLADYGLSYSLIYISTALQAQYNKG
jgi:hypothetical protein